MDIITRDPTFFQNPHKLPLNHLSLTVQSLKKLKKVDSKKDLTVIQDKLKDNYESKPIRIPALDPHWIQKSRSYHSYQPYYMEVSSEDNRCFLEQNRLFLQSIEFLLNCSYQQFWCYVVYEERVKIILDSFIMNAVPWYELIHLNNVHMKLYNEIYDRVSRVYCRMLHDRESDTEYMVEPYKSNLLLQHKIITFPVITQLILLYENTNQHLIQQLLSDYFNKFQTEIANMYEHAKTVFDVALNQFSMHRSHLRHCTSFIAPRPAIFDPNWFEELVIYILDTATTLNSFLRNTKVGLTEAISQQLHLNIARFYNGLFPLIYQAFEDQGELPEKWTAIKERIFENIAITRMELVNVFHQVVTFYLDKIQSSNREFDEDSFETYLGIINSILEEDFFIFDYHNSFRIDTQFENITSNHCNIDRTRLNFVKQCLCNLPELGDLLETHMFQYQNDVKQDVKQELKSEEIVQKPIEKLTIENEAIEKLIMEVMDTLPHLGDAYILECLKHYNYSTTAVISAILDDTIPKNVITSPSHAIRVPPELPEVQVQPILAYKGKKPTYKDAKDMLDDKREMTQVRDMILKASNAAYDPYDEEYDDRDEDNAANIAAYNKRMRKLMTEDDDDPYKYMINRFSHVDIASSSGSDDDGETQKIDQQNVGRSNRGGRSENADRAAGGGGGKHNRGAYRKPDFCENPEMVRERWEASKRGGRSGSSRDVIGRPRGEGQDTTVQHNRDKKNTNKSSRGNHSRKSGADFKRSRGMMP